MMDAELLLSAVKYTKTARHSVPCNGRNTRYGGKSEAVPFSKEIVSEESGRHQVGTAGMTVPYDPEFTVMIFHEGKMIPEITLPGIEALLHSTQVGVGIMAEQNSEISGFQNLVFGQSTDEFQVGRSIIRLLFPLIKPEFQSRFAGLFLLAKFIPVFRIIKTTGMLRDLPGRMKVMIAGKDHLAFLPDKVQAGGGVSVFLILVKGETEACNIPQAGQKVITKSFGLLDYLF